MLATASQATSAASASPVTPRTAATGAIRTKPTSMTHASTEGAPIMRVERDEQNVEVPQQSAAPIPPRIAATGAFSPLYAGAVAACLRGAKQAITASPAQPASTIATCGSTSSASAPATANPRPWIAINPAP